MMILEQMLFYAAPAVLQLSVTSAKCTFLFMCSNRLKNTIYNKIRSIDEAKVSSVFITQAPCNFYVKAGPAKDILIRKDSKTIKENVGVPVECAVCGNQLGFKKGEDYILMNLIEENGVCYFVW